MPVHDWTRVKAGIFHDFHHDWITMLKRALNAGLLPAGYYALAEQVAGGLGPDVLTLDVTPPGPPRAQGNTQAPPAPPAGIALASAPPKVRFTAAAEMDQYARRRSRVAIRHSSGHEVVALIEIVSPGNKASRHLLRAFVEKAVEVLEAGVHLLVADLFPPGPRDPEGIHAAIWSEIGDDGFQLPPDKPLTLASYAAGPLKRAFIEPAAVGDVLPDMPLFLQPESYVPVPLEATYQSAWEGVPKFWRDQLQPSGPPLP
jgi:hypothetical protein